MAWSKRLLAATLFGAAGLPRLAMWLRARRNQEIRIATYHRITDPDTAYDSANVSATPEQFEKQVRLFKKSFDLMRFSDLLDVVDGKATCPQRPLLLSFDDGFADNYVNAYPILKANDVSAAFFISTSHIGHRGLFWFDELAFLVLSTKNPVWTMTDGEEVDMETGDRRQTTKKLLAKLKLLSNADRETEIEHLRLQSGVTDYDSVDPLSFPMTWEQLSEMQENGMEVFSHTHTHPVLSRLESYQEILSEVSESKRLIENRVGGTCEVLAYPVGRWSSYDERVLQATEEAGYSLACVNENGVNVLPFGKRLELNRIGVDNYQNVRSLASVIAWPEMFAY
jgi:peptidoglycan/xylan/chitin deacetylase (PgdA/CDA1 family)